VILLQHPSLGLFATIAGALIVRAEIRAGSSVDLNAAMLLVGATLVIWLIDMIRAGEFKVASSRVNRPLILFLCAGFVSLAIGTATWDPAVPRPGPFLIIQLAQLGIFVLSAAAFWLMANLGQDLTFLRRLFFFWLASAAFVAAIFASEGRVLSFLFRMPTAAVQLPPFRVLLVASAFGQLLFNRRLSWGVRLCMLGILAVIGYAIFYQQREIVSNWLSVMVAICVLMWLRWPRLRWPAVAVLIILVITGTLGTTLYDFAGGDEEWDESGGSRLALIGRVVEVTMRNPITGLGPAAYRPYAQMEPLPYQGAFWIQPNVSSHNNYVDLFSHGGLVSLGLFAWFAVEVTLLGLRLKSRYTEGFEAGYVNTMLATWASSLALMLFADWILPFYYNIGFRGFQASVLVWLFLGGLVALDHISDASDASKSEGH
jgi:hypothetical protein